MYFPPFQLLGKTFVETATSGDEPEIVVPREIFYRIIRNALDAVHVDEAWYRQQYPDVGDAITTGQIASAKAHFVEIGYFEGRQPELFSVSEAWYLKTYKDVADAIKAGQMWSATEHFNTLGYQEGRMSGQNSADEEAYKWLALISRFDSTTKS